MDCSRITLRCFSEDLGLALPDVNSELAADHPMVDELVSRAPRLASSASSLSERRSSTACAGEASRRSLAGGAEERLLKLLAAGLRRQGSSEDAYMHFSACTDVGASHPDDAARIRLEAAARRYRLLSAEIPAAVGKARKRAGHCISATFDGAIPCRMLAGDLQACDELWVAVSAVDLSGSGRAAHSRRRLRDGRIRGRSGEWEAVSAWPEGELSWFEVARYGLLEA